MKGRFTKRKGFSTEALTFGRQRWRDLVAQCRAVAEDVAADREPDQLVYAQFRGSISRTGSADLPIEGESVREFRNGLLASARALQLASGDRRKAAAAMLIAACSAVEQLLEEQAMAASAGWRRQFGDD
jgi:hypothetical protein